jgi:hypothetical protein
MAGLIHPKTEELTRQITASFEKVPNEARQALSKALTAVRHHATSLAEHQWKNHKAPMAAYWRVVGVWCGHFARAIKKSPADKQPLSTSDIAEYLTTLNREDLLYHCARLYEDNTRLRQELDAKAGIIR